MNETSAAPVAHSEVHAHSEGVLLRSIVIGLTAFLTVVDLFATQAILPSLTRHYGVTPAAMGFAVNASTLGMAFSGLAIGYFSREIDRRKGILAPSSCLPSRPHSSRMPRTSRLSPFCGSHRGCAWRRPSHSRSPISANTTAPPTPPALSPPTSPAMSPATSSAG